MQKILSTTAMALTLGAGLAGGARADTHNGALLVYRVWEPGLQPYISRILVTPGYLRMDEGEGSGDYTLFDRKQGIIYNVSSEDHSALVMNPPAAAAATRDDLRLEERSNSDDQAPRIGGLMPQNVSLLANGQVCREMVTVPGLMPEAVAGMRDFQRVLARVQAATQGNIPADMQTPCDLAENIYAPLRQLAHGLPIQDRSPRHSRSLVDYSAAHSFDDSLFVIPDDYRRMPMPGLPGKE